MLDPERPGLDSEPQFKETEPIELWSARLSLQIPYSEFERTVLALASINGQSYTGYISTNDDNEVTSFTRTRYPRKKFGVPSIYECVTSTEELAEAMGGTHVIYQASSKQGFRVVMGLQEGYDIHSPMHTITEVEQVTLDARVTPADIFAVRHTGSEMSVYTEPVAVIQGHTRLLPRIYNLGDTFRQERFTVENFDTHRSYVVETRFCTEPD